MKTKSKPGTRPIITKLFKIECLNNFWCIQGEDAIQLCGTWLRKLWHIPSSTEAVWVSLYRSPEKDRVHVVVPSRVSLEFGWNARVEKRAKLVRIHSGVYILFEQLGLLDKDVYVGLEYKE